MLISGIYVKKKKNKTKPLGLVVLTFERARELPGELINQMDF